MPTQMQRVSKRLSLPKAQREHPAAGTHSSPLPAPIPALHVSAEHGQTHNMSLLLMPRPPRDADSKCCLSQHTHLPPWHCSPGTQHPLHQSQQKTQHWHPETPTQPHSCLAGVAHTLVSPGGHHIPKSLPWIVAAAVLYSPPSPHICLTQLWLSLSPCLPPASPSLLPLRLCLELIPGVINYQFMSNLKFIIHFSHKLPKVLSWGQDEGERQ